MFPETILAGARTVVGVRDHFVELKQRAAPLLEQAAASGRGYFTPSDDEELRHLHVSYWQSRNALIELVVQFHNAHRRPADDQRPAGFLVAYAGALVLVDAARFLRENVLHRPVVRDKLNEPEPHFGIPAGTFDAVQRSLTSPVHAWHLYHARRYYHDQRKMLQELARGTSLEPLTEIIDELQERLDVRLERYLIVRGRLRAAGLATELHRDVLARALYGLQKTVSRLVSSIATVPDYRPQLPQRVVSELHALLQPGDVLVTRKDHALTNYFLPGFWPHAALNLGTAEELQGLGLAEHANLRPRWSRLLECDANEPRRVLESMKDGVWIRSLSVPFCCDAISLIRPRLSSAEISAALARGLFHEGKPYDFDFDFTRSDRLVCTEVVYRSYEGVGGARFKLTRRTGRLTLAAEDLLQMALEGNHFEPLAVFAPSVEAAVATGPRAADLLRRTLHGGRTVSPPQP